VSRKPRRDDFELRFSGVVIAGAMSCVGGFVVFTKEIALEGEIEEHTEGTKAAKHTIFVNALNTCVTLRQKTDEG
jgi:hypothetical protein